jgi:hypothetical protein
MVPQEKKKNKEEEKEAEDHPISVASYRLSMI